jgi:hypothetical protein
MFRLSRTLAISVLTLAGLGVLQLGGKAGAETGGPICRGGDLAGAIVDIQGAAGSAFGRLILTNTSTRSCRLRGYVGAAFVGTNGASIATHVLHDASDPVRTVVLKSGAAAAATIRWSHVPSGTATSCPTARWVRITPPGSSGATRVYFGDTPCRGELQVRALTDPRTVG